MVEKEIEIDGFRSLGLIGNECLVTYNSRREFIVTETGIFNTNNKLYKVFRNTEGLVEELTNYIYTMGFENTNITEEVKNFVAKAKNILDKQFPINPQTVKRVLPVEIKVVGSFDLGIGKILCYADGELELRYNGITTLGNINELAECSTELGRNLINEDCGVSNKLTVVDIVEGIKELHSIYIDSLNKPQELKPKEASTVNPNKSRELVLCVIVTRVIKVLSSGRNLLKSYQTVKELYDGLYVDIYNHWIDSHEPFSMEYVDRLLNERYLSPVVTQNNKSKVAV